MARPPGQARPQDQTIAFLLRNTNILSKLTSLERFHNVQINNIYSPGQNKCTANQLNRPCAYRERRFMEYIWLVKVCFVYMIQCISLGYCEHHFISDLPAPSESDALIEVDALTGVRSLTPFQY